MSDESASFSEDLIRAVELLAETFEARSIRYAIVGGLAAILQGRPRFTQDVDVVLDVPQLALPGLLERLREIGFDLDVEAVTREYVRECMTVFRFRGIRIDWLKPVLPIYARAISGAMTIEWTEGHSLKVVSPEDLILTKMLAYRSRDRDDIETLLAANRDDIDLGMIRREWNTVAEGEDERTAWLEDAIRRNVPGRP